MRKDREKERDCINNTDTLPLLLSFRGEDVTAGFILNEDRAG